MERGLFRESPFRLIDVGCSGGISKFWHIFQDSLQALGIDPVIDECERLNRAEINPNIRYHAAFVGLPDGHPFITKRGDQGLSGANPWDRLSAASGARLLDAHVRNEEKLPVLNDWGNARLADPNARITVNDLAADLNWPTLDFLKIDVDGHDLDVLLSAEKLIKESPVLGVAMEVNYYGTARDTDHTFHNTDRLMRQWGFELFDLTVRRYSVSALPAVFEYDVPAQTRFGRPFQGDALYLRDPCAWKGQSERNLPLNAIQLLKLACLFAAFGLPDHSAELLRDYATVVSPLADAAPLLHLLANEVDPAVGSYDEYIDRFKADPTTFYPSRQDSR